MVRVPLTVNALVPAAPPVIPPVTTGAGHVYVVPAGTMPSVRFTGAVIKLPELQISAIKLLTTGIGFTVTITVNVAPGQVPDVGVTV